MLEDGEADGTDDGLTVESLLGLSEGFDEGKKLGVDVSGVDGSMVGTWLGE